MEEIKQSRIEALENVGPETAAANETVVQFRTRPAMRSRRQPPATDDELMEYRRIRPLLMQIIREWPEFREQWKLVSTTCPLAKRIIEGD